MAGLDLLNLQPTQVCKDLSGRFIEIYGKPKSGKTTLAMQWPSPLLCAFEIGYHALPGIYAQDIPDWLFFKKLCRELKKPEVKEKFKTIVIDTIGIANSMCEDFIKQTVPLANGDMAKTLDDYGYGKGPKLLRTEFERTFRELSNLGYGLVFIAHAKTQDSPHMKGQKQYIPDLSGSCTQSINALVDMIAYLDVEYDQALNPTRYLYLRETPTIYAGSRYSDTPPRIECSYSKLVDAVGAAMEREAMRSNTSLISETEFHSREFVPEKVTLEEAITRAKTLASNYVNQVSDPVERDRRGAQVAAVSNKIFGTAQFNISQATAEQQTMVELFADEIADLS